MLHVLDLVLSRYGACFAVVSLSRCHHVGQQGESGATSESNHSIGITSLNANMNYLRLTLCFSQFLSAKYYRLAEKAGNKTLGNTWYVHFS